MTKKSLQNIPEKKPNNLAVRATSISYQSPIPPPEIIAHYEAIQPGFAERIMKAFEKQSAHRQNLEKIVIEADIKKSYLGLVCGFLIGICSIGATIWMTALGLIENTHVL